MRNILTYLQLLKAHENLSTDEVAWKNAWLEQNPEFGIPKLDSLKYLEYENAIVIYDGSCYYLLDKDGFCLEVSNSVNFTINNAKAPNNCHYIAL